MTSPEGDATAHRPELTPAVLELLVSHDGGVPVGRQSGEGQTSALVAAAGLSLLAAVQQAPRPRELLADAQLSPAAKAPNRPRRDVSTRLPPPLRAVAPVLTPALAWATWPRVDDETRAPGLA